MGSIPHTPDTLPRNRKFSFRDSNATLAVASSTGAVENESIRKDTNLYKLFRPFLLLFRIGGMFFGDAFRTDSTAPRIQRIIEAFFCFYSTVALLLCWFDTSVFVYACYHRWHDLPMTFEDMPTIVEYISRNLWAVQFCVVFLIFYRASLSKHGWSYFIRQWETLSYNCVFPNCKGHERFHREFRKRRNVLLTVALVHLGIQLTSTYGSRANLGEVGDTYVQPEIDIAKRVADFFLSFCFTVPIYFFAMVAFVISLSFRHLKEDLAYVLQSGTGGKCIEDFRKQHQGLCALVQIADSLFAAFLIIEITLSVLQVLFEVFMLQAELDSGTSVNTGNALSYVLWCVTYVSQVTIVLSMGASVNEAAHSPELDLFSVDQNTLTVAQCRQLQIFLTRITCSKIGFTAGGVFVIERSAVAEVFGTYITYQILIFELRLDLKMDNIVESVRDCQCLKSLTA
ncbi:uncharacterized protein LOC129592471 [Paramacrobiotus metropolitanus]|uniref:uncharacterized protein LOC129592471 n=1 Tax=Paramacrobiotus metropolitanus TaxID=2943436 RepID=UPI002445B055|nr:uncharacterized protein LOC129592471 [Paramacrobiotus metropolitanus]